MKKLLSFNQLIARLPFCMLAFALLSCTTPPTASATSFQNDNVPQDLGKSVLLNLNGYYILSMEPVPPFMSEGRVFVPLYRFAALLAVGKEYKYGEDVERAPVSAVLARDNIEVAINNQSIVTITNTQTGQTITPAYSGTETIWRQIKDNLYGVYIPLDIFRDAFGLEVNYDAETFALHITDSNSEFTRRLDEEATLLYKVQPTPIIRPIKFKLEVTNDPEIYEDSAFKITLEIQVPDDYGGKAEDISVALLAAYEGGVVAFAGDSTIRPFTCQNGTQKNTFVCVENLLPEEQRRSPLQYIFSRIGVRIK
jgi:hypothetical protein